MPIYHVHISHLNDMLSIFQNMFDDHKALEVAVNSGARILVMVAWLRWDPALNELFLRAHGFES